MLVTPRSSNCTSSFSARLTPWTTLPSIWLRRPSGLMTSPQSCATTTRRTWISPAAASTATSA